jgi:hypothetical protein
VTVSRFRRQTSPQLGSGSGDCDRQLKSAVSAVALNGSLQPAWPRSPPSEVTSTMDDRKRSLSFEYHDISPVSPFFPPSDSLNRSPSPSPIPSHKRQNGSFWRRRRSLVLSLAVLSLLSVSTLVLYTLPFAPSKQMSELLAAEDKAPARLRALRGPPTQRFRGE